MTPLYLAVVPRRSGRNQLVLHTGVLQSNVKRTEWNVCLFCLHRHIRQQFLKQLFADAFYIRELAHIFVATVCFIKFVEENDVEFIRLQFTDLFGILKNVAIPKGRRSDLPVTFSRVC